MNRSLALARSLPTAGPRLRLLGGMGALLGSALLLMFLGAELFQGAAPWPRLAVALLLWVGTMGLVARLVDRELLAPMTERAESLNDEIVRVEKNAARWRELDQLKSEFLAHMSHELRTPLNSIIGYAELLTMAVEEDGRFDHEMRIDLRAIYDNGQQLLALINDILDLAKIEAGRMELHREPLNLALLLHEVEHSGAGLLHRHRRELDLSVEIEPSLPLVLGDALRLQQVLNNLLSNAIRATEQGSIRLRAFQRDTRVVLEVEDTGVGIPPADLETIFEKFHQIERPGQGRNGHSGLGLAITRHLVQMHGGRLQVRSRLGEGSTFAVELPLAPSESVAPPDTGRYQ